MEPGEDIWDRIFRRKEEIVSRKIAGETLLVPVMGKLADMQRIFSLNAVGECVWQQLDGGKTLREVRDRVAERFEVTKEQAEKDIMEFIDELNREELIAGVD